MNIAFRPHHFLCALCFQGKGYSPSFVINFQAIMDKLCAEEGDKVSIQVVGRTDSICAPCPHKRGSACTSEENITLLDTAHATALAVQPGDQLTWGDAKARIANKVDLAVFHSICKTCSWKEAGICQTQLTNFLQQRSTKL